ncbi:ABC transporter ATP-binding protein [Alkaliphilus serpentinus]|uniref:ABC transporter ATP-binding protein n=2 Tax=Alkaliphilus serpentinus TaxID=1482731 RepID=A0A833HNV8_9FIRM|nr:ABC transporter ATP-binding protein [Alkaliphilus serpentinus]KAB3530050.1 ABC transporter ATP-binding protein [Alkaliphilus serpentinus]
MIEAKNLTKDFDDIEALKGVNVVVEEGSIYGLLGSNGAGKTTLLKTLAGIYKEDSGEVSIFGERVFENPALKERVLFIPDSLYFFAGYTLKDMAEFYKSIYTTWNQERYITLQRVFNLDPNKKIMKLSKGMQRQVAIWLALSTMPKVLILDEPLDGLDSVMRQKVKNLLIQDVADHQLTIIVSSHNLRELEDFCDHIGILHEGAIVLEKDMDDLKRDIHKIQVAFRSPLSEEVFNSMNLLYKEKRGSVYLFIARGDKNAVTKYFAEFDPVLLDILPLTLEEIFIYEMGDVGYAIENIIIK